MCTKQTKQGENDYIVLLEELLAVTVPWSSYLCFGGGDGLLIRVLVQVDGLGLLHRLLSPWTSVQKPGPALQGGAC